MPNIANAMLLLLVDELTRGSVLQREAERALDDLDDNLIPFESETSIWGAS